MTTSNALTVKFRRIDRDGDFEAYLWGAIRNGEIVAVNDTGVDKFGPFDEFVQDSKAMFRREMDPTKPYPWLDQWPDYGSQAHHARAEVHHDELDRILVGLDHLPLAGVLVGLDAPSSTYETITALYRQRDQNTRPGAGITVRYTVTDDLGESDTDRAAQYRQTAKNIFAEVSNAVRYSRYDHPGIPQLTVIPIRRNIPRGRIGMNLRQIKQIDWEQYEAASLATDASVYVGPDSTDTERAESWTKRYAAAIRSAKTFSELKTVIEQFGPIEGSSRTYSPETLIKRINRLQQALNTDTPPSEVDFSLVTRSLGLRECCRELYEHER